MGKPQSVVFNVLCHSEHDGGVKFFKKLLWEPLQKLLSLVVWHCRLPQKLGGPLPTLSDLISGF